MHVPDSARPRCCRGENAGRVPWRAAMTPLGRSLLQSVPGLRTSEDEADRTFYSRDLWPRHHLAVRAGLPSTKRPGAIAWPACTEEVALLTRWARQSGVS